VSLSLKVFVPFSAQAFDLIDKRLHESKQRKVQRIHVDKQTSNDIPQCIWKDDHKEQNTAKALLSRFIFFSL
jgi:hypothetical protein